MKTLPLVAAASVVFASYLNANDVRTWSDTSGQFSVEARLVSSDDDVVVLERKDTLEQVSVPIKKLSPKDREHLSSVNFVANSRDSLTELETKIKSYSDALVTKSAENLTTVQHDDEQKKLATNFLKQITGSKITILAKIDDVRKTTLRSEYSLIQALSLSRTDLRRMDDRDNATFILSFEKIKSNVKIPQYFPVVIGDLAKRINVDSTVAIECIVNERKDPIGFFEIPFEVGPLKNGNSILRSKVRVYVKSVRILNDTESKVAGF